MSDVDSDRFRHLTGDYYWDAERVRPLWWLVTGILTAVAPPVGAPFIGFFAVMSLTTRQTVDEILENDLESAVRRVR